MNTNSHIDIARLVAYFVDAIPLNDDEYSHLLNCADCRHAGVDAAANELDDRRNESRAS